MDKGFHKSRKLLTHLLNYESYHVNIIHFLQLHKGIIDLLTLK